MQAVDPAHGVGGNLRGKHFADPIVIRLDALRRAAAANEMGGAEHRHERLPLARDAARGADELGRHRPAADRQRLEEAGARPVRAHRAACRTSPRRWAPTRLHPADAGVAGQLLEHERAAARFTGDPALVFA